jgi:LysR family transcriptional regulator (chromosome initiation inhibitor)
MFDRAQLQALAAVLTGGSFEAAARALGVTPSAISQRIRALEERAGAVLVRRGQPARATAAGARLVRHAEDLALLEAGVAADLGVGRGARPTLKIAVNADSLATWIPAALAGLPDVLFDLVIDDQDHSADSLHRGAVQAAVTGEDTALPGCDCHPLGALR